ncbi:MAG: ribonuclease P protein component [Sphingomonadales bacterium]
MPTPPQTLKKRRDYLAMNTAPKWVTPGFILQYRSAPGGEAHLGYTVSRKVGNAVCRNTVKRRLRALAALHLSSEHADMVLIGRPGIDKLPFQQLEKDVLWALRRVKQKAVSL